VIVEIGLDPVLVHLGPIALHWYGVMYVVGILVGTWVATPVAVAWGIPRDRIEGAVGWGVVGGLVGGRLYYVAQQPLGPYLAAPWRIAAAWEGGMAFFGAILGAAIALALYARREGVSFWRLVDAGAIFATVGQAFGRLGNVVNGDIVGYPTDGSWGFVYTNPGTFAPERGVAYQPAPLYEIAANVVIFLLLWRLRRGVERPGMLFALYLALYAVSQLVVFVWRANEVVALGFKQAQLTALVVLVVAGALACYLRARERRP
jgi:phosphatidylglycerol:prolipoprotein diacylglycerol transferase